MPEGGAVTVYCDGPRDSQHERFIIDVFTKADVGFAGNHSWLRGGTWTDDVGRTRRPKRPKGTSELGTYVKQRFQCARCGLDEQRTGLGIGLATIFDQLDAAGLQEISIQNLMRLAD